MEYQLKVTRLVIIALLVFCCVLAHAGYPMRAKDARGKLITIKKKPLRIVSLAPGNTEILYAVGAGDNVVGVNKYCDYPAEVKKKPKVGDMNTNIEAVVALKPDLVLAHAFMNDSAIRRLENVGLTVFAIDPKTIASVARDIRTIGKIVSHPKEAEAAAAKLEKQVAEVKKSRAGKPKLKVMVEIQANPLWVAGPQTFVNEMLGIVNAENIAHDARPGYVTFSQELAVSRNPDVILAGLKSDVEYFLAGPAWKNTNAVKRKKVYVINNDRLLRAGPRLGDGLKSLATALEK